MMSGYATEMPRGTVSHRPHHSLSRSISEITSVPRVHRSHHHHNPLHRRDKDDKTPQSAAPNLQPGIDSSKSEAVTPADSLNPSRRASITGADDNIGMAGTGWPKQLVKDGQVKEERGKNFLRATELNKCLTELNTLSNNTTRRLDNTYYSVLEKLAALQSTIASLKELASITRELDDGFKDESREVVKDAELQINSFDKFETQQRKIGGLETRIKRARERIKKLGDRVEEVRDRVETWETLEDDWQQRMRQRLKVVWAIVVVLFLVVVGLLIFPSTPSRTSGVLQGFNATNPSMDVPELEGRLLNETMNFKRRGIGALESLRRPLNDVLEDDPRLLAFDEL